MHTYLMTLETVSLEKHTYGGEALGRLSDGRAVFVPYALPGETVRVHLVEDKKRFARAELVEIIEPSAKRIEPRCPHFFTPPVSPARAGGTKGGVLPARGGTEGGVPPTNEEETEGREANGVMMGEDGSAREGETGGVPCGGCHYQHIPYKEQLLIKTEILRDQLNRIGKIENPPIQPTVPCPQPWNYRNHVQFHISPDGRLGFQAPRAEAIIPIEECHLPEQAINQFWPQLDIESIPGLDRVGVRLGANDDLMIVLESSDPQPVGLNVDMPLSVVHLGPGGSLVMAGDDHIVIEVGERLFRVSAASFFRVNTTMAEKMAAHLLDNLPLTEETTLLDAYCGVGLFSAFLAPHVGRLIGIEASPSASEDFTTNLDEFDHVELYEAPVEDVLPALDLHPSTSPSRLRAGPDVILVDPPHSGLARGALDGILSLAPQTLAYISCDPATLARDAKRLTNGGYQLQQITPFDLSPQTYHIESISFWVKP
ncbi:MAG: class I SAM-dependent RNA methyltransferase [Anaerolineales bacterium]|nr:class I SAM-dependent RNA methyltransferase [Anaerolineales bacterium]